jgi:hypothetical protein
VLESAVALIVALLIAPILKWGQFCFIDSSLTSTCGTGPLALDLDDCIGGTHTSTRQTVF